MHSILYVVYVAAVVTILFSLSIFVHELGHFLVARWTGMVVETFSLGFGPALWKRTWRGVTYRIGCLPLGGYVALPQMEPAEEKEKQSDSAPRKSDAGKPGQVQPMPPAKPLAKMAVALAGSIGNFAFAILIAWVVYLAGKPSTPAERCAVIGFVATNTPAYELGLRIGHEILAVNGRGVSNWMDVVQEATRFDEADLTVRAGLLTNTIRVPTVRNEFGIRVMDGLDSMSLCTVGMVDSGSPAEDAGLRPDDRIIAFNGTAVLSIPHLVDLVAARPDQPTALDLIRADRPLTLTVTPRLDPALGRARIGIRFDSGAVEFDRVVHPRPGEQIRAHSTLILRVLRSLVTPREARGTLDGLGGPVMVVYGIQNMVRKGIMIAIWFTGLLNVNFAILNLLPLPVLDGGHIVFSLWELIRRRPVPPVVFRWLTQIFAGLLILAMLALTYRDTLRVFLLEKSMRSEPPAQTNVPVAVPVEPAPAVGEQ
jgi:regulator of sigma E protease